MHRIRKQQDVRWPLPVGTGGGGGGGLGRLGWWVVGVVKAGDIVLGLVLRFSYGNGAMDLQFQSLQLMSCPFKFRTLQYISF